MPACRPSTGSTAASTFYLTDWLRWFGGYRQAFGAFQYDGRLIRTGLSAIARAFLGGDAPRSTIRRRPSSTTIRTLWSWVVRRDLLRAAQHCWSSAGVGYSPLIDNVDLHARAILPVTDRIALQLIAAHNSINADTRVTAGLRFTW